MEFIEAIQIIKSVLGKIGTTIVDSKYDGIIVKKLESSNTLDANRTTKQSHIAITGAQMDMFPYVRADGYFEVDYAEEDTELKKYFVAQIPAYIHKENITYLDNSVDICKEPEELTHISIVRSRRNGAADQIQMSMTYMDSPKYVQFRRIVHAGSYMIMLKRSKELMYDLYAVKPNDIINEDNDLSELNNSFYKLATNTVVKLDEITIPMQQENLEEDEYKKAATTLNKFIEETGFDIPVSQDSINSIRDEFISRYNYNVLEQLSDEKLLERVFYTVGDNTDALCCWIEMNKDCKYAYGSISGGSAYKFGLFQKKETGVWTTGSPQKSQELSDEEAVVRGKEIVSALIRGAKIIENATLTSLDEYEKLDDELRNGVGEQYYNWAWFHKYYSIIFQDKLSSYHNEEWQCHILYCFGIKPSNKYYARSGQIAMIQNYGNWKYRQFFSIHAEKYGMPKIFIRIGTQGKENYCELWKKHGVVGIGWSELGPLQEYSAANSLDKNSISDILEKNNYPGDLKTASRKAGEIIRFYETDENSIFVPADGEKIFGLVDNIGQYYFDDSEEFAHLKPGKWCCTFPVGESLPDKSEGLRTTCIQIKNEVNLLYLYEKYYNCDDEVEEEEVDDMDDKKLMNCLEIEREPRTVDIHPLNCIIYGAPGTGKTYSTAEYAQAIIDGISLDEFKEKNPDRKSVMKRYNELVKSRQIVFTTFHQSYGYEEFIQGLRPDTKASTMTFKTVDGVFKHIADKALNDMENKYVIIIDEINRANISKVFGELITLIEEDKRWGELNQTSATLQSGDVFAVPNNLYIVGTMNSADKSISLIDAALRRRFEFIEQKPDASLVTDPTLHDVLEKLNNSLADQLDSADLLIGHSYFMNRSEKDLPKILNNSIIPLLYEYFYDNKKKVADVLGNAMDNVDYVVEDDKLGRIFIERQKKS